MKALTREQIQARKEKAVRFVENVLNDPDRASEIEDEDLESYAARRGFAITNSTRSNSPMAKKYSGLNKDELLDKIEDLEAENSDLNDRLDSISDIIASDDDDDNDDDSSSDDDSDDQD